MSITIIGAGQVGQALATAFSRQGESIVFGVTDPARHADTARRIGEHVRVASVPDAVQASPVVILAVPYPAALVVAQSVPDWQGRVLVDATNPLAPGLSGLRLGTTDSGAESVARAAHNARVVKAFNTTGAENMADSRYPGGTPFMPVCGDDLAARQQVLALATLIGFDAVDMGPLQAARVLEPLALAWIQMAIVLGHGRQFALARLHRH